LLPVTFNKFPPRSNIKSFAARATASFAELATIETVSGLAELSALVIWQK
jgi:hypothetical protein